MSAQLLDVSMVSHWVDGAQRELSGERTGDVTNPATGEVIRRVAYADAAGVDAAVSRAAAAYREWSRISLTRRVQVMFAFRELLHGRREELASLITEEHGKLPDDALGEVARGLEVVEFACGIPQLLKGEYSANVSTGIDVYSMRRPLGVVAIISPFNFPAMVPLWFFPIAIAAGNSVVLKPSERDPSAAGWMAALLRDAGLPAGVFNVVHGDSVTVDALLTHPLVQAVSFVGSTPVARHVYQTAANHGKRVQALGGAKNHMVVLPDADLDSAADAAVGAAFGSAGERCMAISALVAVGTAGDLVVPKIAARMRSLRVGAGRACDMGPLISRAHRDRVASYIAAGIESGASCVVDGRDSAIDGPAGGFWLGPTLLDSVSTSASVYRDEIFGPVLCVLRVDTLDEALRIVNASPFGNGAAIFTSDGGAARRFQEEAEVGMVGINVPIPVPAAYHSFGGWKSSLFGDAHAYGGEGVRFFTRGKVITGRWLNEPAPHAGLGFPQHD